MRENEPKPASRGRRKKTWIKLHCDGILRGSINYQLELEEQAIWMKMLALAAVCGGKEGWIQDNDERPLPHSFIANELHCPLEVFEVTLQKCCDEGRCQENSHGIEITHWAYYQSEYARQKPYREEKKLKELFSATTPEDAEMMIKYRQGEISYDAYIEYTSRRIAEQGEEEPE